MAAKADDFIYKVKEVEARIRTVECLLGITAESSIGKATHPDNVQLRSSLLTLNHLNHLNLQYNQQLAVLLDQS